MEMLYERTKLLTPVVSPYCPGCLHGLIMKIIAEIIEEMGIVDETIAILPVGCSAAGKKLLDMDLVCALHGRAPAVATGIVRCEPNKLVFTYQGDGDLAAIGLAEIISAANRGENFVTVFVNNSTYGMTGGQMAPTTILGQKTTTTPYGRDAKQEGFPMKMCELIATLEAPIFVARYALDVPVNVLKAKKSIRKAFELQRQKKGFSFIELLSNCPTNWGLSPLQCTEYMREHTMKIFPQRVFKDVTGGEMCGK
ncbi:2-oxoglutarate oxidoreductase [Synergistales bacterium]|nr:2-oxoglutarate oxidoreductase [Synergistales bacterium]